MRGQGPKVKFARMAWRNVLRNWRHSLATILAIASGFMAVSLFDGFMRQLDEINFDGYSTRGMLGQLIVERRGAQDFYAEDPWRYSLDKDDQAFIEGFLSRDNAVARRVRFLQMIGIINANNVNAVVIGNGYDVAEGLAVRGEKWAWNTVAGLPLDKSDGKILLGRGLGRLLGCDLSEKDDFFLPGGNYVAEDRPWSCKAPSVMVSVTTEAAQVNALEIPIAGFMDVGFREADKRAIAMPLEEAQRLLDTDKVSMVAVQLKDGHDLAAFTKRFRDAAKAANRQLDILPWMEHNLAAYVRGAMELLQVFRNLFMAIVVTIGVMSVANTMMKSVNERIREIGTLRSLGFLRSELTFVFACEGFFLSLLACALGLVMTLIVAGIVSVLGISFKAGVLSVPIHLRVGYAPGAWLVSALLLSLLATGTAWICARRASRMVVADAMRHV